MLSTRMALPDWLRATACPSREVAVQHPLAHACVIHYAVSYMRDHTPIPPPLHELEAEVMEEVWRRGVSSVRGVMEAINSRAAKPRAYTTFMTIMSRLDSKGLLERTREGKTDFYRATHTPARYSDLRAQADVDSLVDQFGELALGHFARQMAQLNPQRRRALERLAREK